MFRDARAHDHDGWVQAARLLDILGVCGILCTTRHPGYAAGFVPYARRALPSRRFVFAHYPVCWWTAQDGVNAAALAMFLAQLSGRRSRGRGLPPATRPCARLGG